MRDISFSVHCTIDTKLVYLDALDCSLELNELHVRCQESLQSLSFLYVDFVSAAFIMNVSFSKYSTCSICIVIAGVLFILFIIDIARVSSGVI